MTTLRGERRQPFPHRAIEAFNQGGIEQPIVIFSRCSAISSVPHLSLRVHLHHPFLLGALDHRGDTQIRPYL